MRFIERFIQSGIIYQDRRHVLGAAAGAQRASERLHETELAIPHLLGDSAASERVMFQADPYAGLKANEVGGSGGPLGGT